MTRPRPSCLVCVCSLLACAFTASASAAQQNAAFTYQGVLKNGATVANGNFDLQFKLFDAAAAGSQIGSTIIQAPVTVTDGLFQTSLDFGALALSGDERWLEIAVGAANNGNGPFTTLTPRQKLASTPYAAYALNAALGGSYANAVNFGNAGNTFAGDGAGLTNLNAAAISSGVIGNARTSGTASGDANTLVLRDGSGGFSAGAISATSFTGDGSGLTNLNASNITSGTLADARLSASLLARIPEIESVVGLLASEPMSIFASDMAVSGDLAIVIDDLPALMRMLDVSDPLNIVQIVDVDPAGEPTAVAIAGTRAYVANGNLRIYD
ncbi:MAG TPA: hypothetical protein VFX76_22310, partial [Roseiflexaceae bacterium]|nr:hypothetical protein [Roseiflexaceae bacterium]